LVHPAKHLQLTVLAQAAAAAAVMYAVLLQVGVTYVLMNDARS
jgi:hypothetical protein